MSDLMTADEKNLEFVRLTIVKNLESVRFSVVKNLESVMSALLIKGECQ